MTNTVQATRAELEQVLDHLNAIRKVLTGILEREVSSDVKGDIATHDPTYTGRVIPPIADLHDSGDVHDPRD